MINIEGRLKKTLSSLAGNEALVGALDEKAAAEIEKWGAEVAEQFVRQTSTMEDDSADAFLAPRLTALRKLLRAVGGWAAEMDQSLRQEWWTRIEQLAKILYSDEFVLPAMPAVAAQLIPGSNMVQAVELVKNLIQTQKPQG
jgi:hypothetical protein